MAELVGGELESGAVYTQNIQPRTLGMDIIIECVPDSVAFMLNTNYMLK